MAAQPGNNLALLYRPQGPRQTGGSITLLYGGSVEPLRKRISTGFALSWAAAVPLEVPTTAPFVVSETQDRHKRAPWAKGAPRHSAKRSAWAVAGQQDQHKHSPWGMYARRAALAARVPWGVARKEDQQAAMPWGEYARCAELENRFWWAVARVQDQARDMPWGQFAGCPALVVQQGWPRARPLGPDRYLPWSRYSRQLSPGWGVVTPGGEIPVDEHGTVLVPIKRVYVTVNTLTLTRASDGALLPCEAFGMSLDVDSWTWQWQATLHAAALPLVTPGPGGDPVEVLATINGTPYRLACESYTRNRQFGSTRIAVRGRGRAAILDAPYAPALNHGNSTDRTAEQLMGDVLTINGVSIGWDVEWNLTDWLVPGNVWALQGPYIAGILDIAGAAGGYVQPHDTAQTLRILPRYPAAPWDWASLTPDFELPAAVVAVEGTEWLQKPAYNRVFVSGTTAGVIGQVTRDGTAGDVIAPMVTHPLITHADAARQRGMAELSDTGRQARLSLRLPVLEETGVIKPGALVRYVDNGVPQLGLVRGTQVDWSRPTLRQVLDVETHPA